MLTLNNLTFDEKAGPALASKYDFPPTVQVFLQSSNFGVEEDVYHSKGRVILKAHTNGFTAYDNSSGVAYHGLLPYEDITYVKFTKRLVVETKTGFNPLYFIGCFVLLIPFFIPEEYRDDVLKPIALNCTLFGFIASGILSILYPQKVYYRSFTVYFTNNRHVTFTMYEGYYGNVLHYFKKYIPEKVIETPGLPPV